ncbi:uncharacterized protein Z518_08100 [Rhinocladiella mackenziei CBS 650.93]|uniref:F-box domain-containing protein n=1 Tax=Rhinocladiella mackenziei CBS 650.93 TaxID=1442369 RepID=A0A0D2IFW9_9EURO|nr:uncharacterized protein Z518_08100 [Rhinocladiella mackenziei CBS 650.93]KIX02161.1 hypothetical protein Z518_08100 [Rhinocladiella mackenziei CBS 650.93]
MLQDLPVEVIEQIVGYLPTASSVINLSLTNRKIHAIVSANNYAIFRSFVRRAFPTIDTPPLWRDVARTLTSRSRAWERRAFLARECYPPAHDIDDPQGLGRVQTVGYHPVIDSYEVWQGVSWGSRKEVLAWGAAGRLRTRTVKDGVSTWSSFRIPDDHRQDLDILDVRLLRTHQHHSTDGESIILRRANREIIRIETTPTPDVFRPKSRYVIKSEDISCMDVSRGPQPLLAACDPYSIHLFSVNSPGSHVLPASSVLLEDKYRIRRRQRCAKFLSETRLAIGVQYLEGKDRAPINIYDIGQAGVSPTPLAESLSYSEPNAPCSSRHSAHVICPLDDSGPNTCSPGQMFLSGWTDGVARLHDTRVLRKPVAEYVDYVDDGQILSLLPIGRERFLAGSHQNGCLKTFDFRMPGAKPYSYLDARPPIDPQYGEPIPSLRQPFDRNEEPRQRDINIFLTPFVNRYQRLWQPLPTDRQHRGMNYRGSVYSLSSPSPSSPTIYAGIENHVLRLDFVATDDYKSAKPNLLDLVLGLDDKSSRIFDFSCYERQRHGHETTDAVLLRKQTHLSPQLRGRGGQIMRWDSDPDSYPHRCWAENGWDERWKMEMFDRRTPWMVASPRWRSNGHAKQPWRTR